MEKPTIDNDYTLEKATQTMASMCIDRIGGGISTKVFISSMEVYVKAYRERHDALEGVLPEEPPINPAEYEEIVTEGHNLNKSEKKFFGIKNDKR